MHARRRRIGRRGARRIDNPAMPSPVPSTPKPRGRPVLLVALILLFVVVLPFVAGRVLLHFWTQEPPAPVPAATIAEIVREAQSRYAAHTPASVPWKSMDARRLRGLLQTELFKTAPEEVRLLLVDQAAAWDVLHFDRPSDILAQWQRLGLSNGLEVPPKQQPPIRLERTWVATSEWSDEAGAELALWQCLPSYAWGQHAMPPLMHALRTGSGWFASQSPVPDFGGCVHKLRERAPFEVMTATDANQRYPDTDRGRRTARVLLKKLPALIRDIGCGGTGADDCVLLLEALASLGADHATMAPLLERVAPSFAPPADLAVMVADPVAPWGTPKPTGAAVPAWASPQTAERLLQTWVYLDARVQAFAVPTSADDPLPKGEPGATIARLFDVAVALQHVEQVGGPLASDVPNALDDPWPTVERLARAQPAWREALRERGEAAASAPGCGPLAGLPENKALAPPPEFWLGFGARKLAKVDTSCGRLPTDALVHHFEGGAGDPIVQELAPLVGRGEHARAHVEILRTIAAYCPLKQDPLALCAWLRDFNMPIAREGAKALPLKPGQAWTALSREVQPALADLGADQVAQHPQWRKHIVAAIARLPAATQWIVQRQWIAPGGSAMAAWVTRDSYPWDDPPGVAAHARHFLLLVDDRGARLVNLPEGLEESLSTLSDIDGDGNVELWSEADEGECDGEDLKPGIDCGIYRAWLSGEVFGNEVAPFLNGPWPAPPQLAHAATH
jgi:hypothetical protein